ncbi:MAG: hypothetical protein IJM81_09245 [Prevotella sp.]|nr:hypothetical protein [Prevotella sp.]
MKRNILMLSIMILCAVTAYAKKVKVTIDGQVSPSQTKLYLIVNEDTANAVRVPITDAQFSITVKVDKDAFIRLHDYKDWPERSIFVLIPDSRHITVDWRTGSIEGSPMSKKLKEEIIRISREGPGNFHIDVFSEDPEAWAEARVRERSIRAQMEMRQRETIGTVIRENADNNIPAWVYYCYKSFLSDPPIPLEALVGSPTAHPKWMDHPILKQQ